MASWAIRFAASLNNIVTVLSGMSTLDQVRDNVATMEHFRKLDDRELAVVEKARKALESIPSIPCTACEYCVEGCPQKIGIPNVFASYNRELIHKDTFGARRNYEFAVRSGGKASDCVACGKCEAVCPQRIGIIENMKTIAAAFE